MNAPTSMCIRITSGMIMQKRPSDDGRASVKSSSRPVASLRRVAVGGTHQVAASLLVHELAHGVALEVAQLQGWGRGGVKVGVSGQWEG